MTPPRDEDSLGGRLRRYAQVTTAVGGVAARAVGGRVIGGGVDSGRLGAELRQALGGIKGPLMKVAQMLATIPDALPADLVQELAQLQAQAPSMGWSFVRRRMAAELGPDWLEKFASFEREASAAASLGQVHRARSLDGRTVACKLQYPDMGSAVEADLRQLALIFAIHRRYDSAVGTDQIHAEISARLREELDYDREARHLAMYREMLAGVSGVEVPAPLPELSTRRLLTMTWLDGTPLLEAAKARPESGNTLAMRMYHAWYIPFHAYGIIHGDPHLGNYTVRPDDTLNLLDFGCVRVFPPSFVRGVIDLYRALLDDDQERAIEAYRTWGFSEITHELVEVLGIWARFVYAPLMEDRVRPIEETNATVYGRTAAQKVHRALRRVGGVTIPREFVYMDRVAIGLGSVFLHLKAAINWYRVFQELIRDFDEATLERRQDDLLRRYGIDVPA